MVVKLTCHHQCYASMVEEGSIIDLKTYPFLCQLSGKTLEGHMYTWRLIFSQVMDFMPLPIFRRCVVRYQGDFKTRKFSCLDQFLCMAFAQLTYRESLRDIEVCLRSQNKKLYHMGICGNLSRSTLAEANEKRDWRIYAELAPTLIATARKLYNTETVLNESEETVYALDSTTINLAITTSAETGSSPF